MYIRSVIGAAALIIMPSILPYLHGPVYTCNCSVFGPPLVIELST